jgi:phosphate transport system substrate-binding protein
MWELNIGFTYNKVVKKINEGKGEMIMKYIKSAVLSLLIAVFAISAAACSGGSKSKLAGAVKADGSSTVGPITQAVAEEFKTKNPDVNTSVGTSGTTGGMKKFVAGEIDIADASRKIKQEEIDQAKAANIEAIEFEVAYDGIAIVVNKENTWATDMTPEELNKMWAAGAESTVNMWSDIRPEWPAEPIKFYSPGTDSGTFEYFTEAINHSKKKEIRADITASEDDNVLVKGVAGDRYAIGYFGVAYYEENADTLNIVKVNGISPTQETVMNGTYKPLSRPLYIYVSKKSFERPEVKEFIKFYMTNVKNLVKEVGYFPLEDTKYEANLKKVDAK